MEKGRVSLYVAKERNENSFNLENRVLPVSTSPRSPIESLLATLLAPFSSLDWVELKGGRKEGGKGGTGQRVVISESRKYGGDTLFPPSSSRRGAIANVFRCKFPQSASGT